MVTNTPTASDKVVEFNNVSLGYGSVTVLEGINASVTPGQVVALMGGSGSGKTTLLRAITGQIKAQKGQVVAFGKNLANAKGEPLRELRQRMGVLFQQGALFTDLNVFENVAFPLREHENLSESEITSRVLDKLDAVGLRAAAHLEVS